MIVWGGGELPCPPSLLQVAPVEMFKDDPYAGLLR
jgi:hypothetical protein